MKLIQENCRINYSYLQDIINMIVVTESLEESSYDIGKKMKESIIIGVQKHFNKKEVIEFIHGLEN